MWTNACCSHPQHTAEELQTTENFIGPRKAAIRRAKFELGIHDLALPSLHCGARILYYADADEHFAEYEMDYIIFAKQELQPFNASSKEVKDHCYVSIDRFDQFLDERNSRYGETITPWFRLLKERSLGIWWEQLCRTGKFPDEAAEIVDFTKHSK